MTEHALAKLRLALALMTLVHVLGCWGRTGLKDPPLGVTDQFVGSADPDSLWLARYDFAKLQGNYGLVVFSYDIQYSDDVRLEFPNGDTRRQGLRFWEYEFPAGGWDVSLQDHKFGFWVVPRTSMVNWQYNLTMVVQYHKHRIVYAGRIVVNLDDYFESGPRVGFHFDEDLGPWLKKYADRTQGIKIDTVIMELGGTH